MLVCFFFKQKTAYEVRISDWSSDVCSSDLGEGPATPAPSLDGMRFIEGGAFTMGSDRFYSEERPLRRVKVDGFWIDEVPVTNAAFAEFVAATGYRTLAELPPDPKLYPGADLEGVDRKSTRLNSSH